MYYSIAFLVFFMMAGINMEQPIDQVSIVDHQEATEEKKVEKRKKKIVDINGLRGKYTVQVGQQLRYSASIHGSVGYTASASSSDSVGLPLTNSFIEYDNKRRAGMSGGDSATKYFIFDAKKVGTYEIDAQHFFRGDLENQFTITITIVEE